MNDQSIHLEGLQQLEQVQQVQQFNPISLDVVPPGASVYINATVNAQFGGQQNHNFQYPPPPVNDNWNQVQSQDFGTLFSPSAVNFEEFNHLQQEGPFFNGDYLNGDDMGFGMPEAPMFFDQPPGSPDSPPSFSQPSEHGYNHPPSSPNTPWSQLDQSEVPAEEHNAFLQEALAVGFVPNHESPATPSLGNAVAAKTATPQDPSGNKRKRSESIDEVQVQPDSQKSDRNKACQRCKVSLHPNPNHLHIHGDFLLIVS